MLLVEDHALLRESLRLVAESMGHFTEVIEVGSLAGAMLDLEAQPQPPRLIMLDLGLPDAEGATALQAIGERYPGAAVLVVSGLDEPAKIDEAFALGARGYVPKNSSARTLRAAIEAVLEGELHVPPQVLPSRWQTQRPLPAPRAAALPARLTRRQSDVLLHLARGLTNKEIAAALDISLSTVRVHLSAIFKLLGVENRTQAATSSTALKLCGTMEPRQFVSAPERSR